MAYKNEEGKIITGKEKVKIVTENLGRYKVGAEFWYVGRTKETGNRIVCYDGIILEILDNDMYRVQFIDRERGKSKIPFEKTVPKKIIHF